MAAAMAAKLVTAAVEPGDLTRMMFSLACVFAWIVALFRLWPIVCICYLQGQANRIADMATTVNGRCVSSGNASPYFTTTVTSCSLVMFAGMEVHRSGS